MSWKATGKVWDKAVNGSKQTVLLALADHADHEGRNIRPGIPLICYKTGLSRPTVKRVIRSFRKRGWIVVTKKSRQHTPPTYRINFDAIPDKPPFVDEHCQSDTHEFVSQRDQNDTPEHNQRDHNTEPSEEIQRDQFDPSEQIQRGHPEHSEGSPGTSRGVTRSTQRGHSCDPLTDEQPINGGKGEDTPPNSIRIFREFFGAVSLTAKQHQALVAGVGVGPINDREFRRACSIWQKGVLDNGWSPTNVDGLLDRLDKVRAVYRAGKRSHGKPIEIAIDEDDAIQPEVDDELRRAGRRYLEEHGLDEELIDQVAARLEGLWRDMFTKDPYRPSVRPMLERAVGQITAEADAA